LELAIGRSWKDQNLGGSIFGGPFFQTWLRGCEGYAGKVLEEGVFAMRTKVRVLVPVPVVLFCCRGDCCWKMEMEMDMSWRGSWSLEFGVGRSAEQICAAGFQGFCQPRPHPRDFLKSRRDREFP
jgi:hypothetical protein